MSAPRGKRPKIRSTNNTGTGTGTNQIPPARPRSPHSSDDSEDEELRRRFQERQEEEANQRRVFLEQRERKEAMRRMEHERRQQQQQQQPHPVQHPRQQRQQQEQRQEAAARRSGEPAVVLQQEDDEQPHQQQHQPGQAEEHENVVGEQTSEHDSTTSRSSSEDDSTTSRSSSEDGDEEQDETAALNENQTQQQRDDQEDDEDVVELTEEELEAVRAMDKFDSFDQDELQQQQQPEPQREQREQLLDDEEPNRQQQQQQQDEDEHEQFADSRELPSLARRRGAKQHFEFFLILDFECTCDNGARNFDSEIIEIPALLFDTERLQVVAEFHTYVRPLRNPELTDFCKDLTGIRPEQVLPAEAGGAAVCYDEALLNLSRWLDEALATERVKKQQQQQQQQQHNNNENTTNASSSASASSSKNAAARVCVLTDGPCDIELFAHLYMHQRDGFTFPSFFHRYLDIKQTFKDEYGDGRFLRIREMLQVFGMSFVGHLHSGIDDARNLARIVTKMIEGGTVFDSVFHVTNRSAAQSRVPNYIWNRAKQAVRSAPHRGQGPEAAAQARVLGADLSSLNYGDRVRAYADSRGGGGGRRVTSDATSWLATSGVLRKASKFFGNLVPPTVASFFSSLVVTSVRIRAGEFVAAPATPLLILCVMLCAVTWWFSSLTEVLKFVKFI